MKYDKIGVGYDGTRRVDPRIADRILNLLAIRPDGRCVDVACGTGNYTKYLSDAGLNIAGCDQSATMIEAARAKAPMIAWHQADALSLTFEDGSFQGVVCTNAIHHFDDLEASFSEINRIVSDGRLVLFTSTSEQMRGYWLNAYFPVAMEKSIAQMPTWETIQAALTAAGFRVVEYEPWYVPREPVDLFLYSGKHKPSLYLDPVVRRGISTFCNLADVAEVGSGIERLTTDIASGEIRQVIDRYDTLDGDYILVAAAAKA